METNSLISTATELRTNLGAIAECEARFLYCT